MSRSADTRSMKIEVIFLSAEFWCMARKKQTHKNACSYKTMDVAQINIHYIFPKRQIKKCIAFEQFFEKAKLQMKLRFSWF